jgi:hypothetical protein
MSNSNRTVTIGRVLSALAILFLSFDVAIKLVQLPIVGDTMAQLGYARDLGLTIGIVELVCLVLYVVPRTAVLGAILWTAVFGGGIATHIRVDSPLFSHILFGVYLGLFVWGGLYLRNPRVRELIPVAR